MLICRGVTHHGVVRNRIAATIRKAGRKHGNRRGTWGRLDQLVRDVPNPNNARHIPVRVQAEVRHSDPVPEFLDEVQGVVDRVREVFALREPGGADPAGVVRAQRSGPLLPHVCQPDLEGNLPCRPEAMGQHERGSPPTPLGHLQGYWMGRARGTPTGCMPGPREEGAVRPWTETNWSVGWSPLLIAGEMRVSFPFVRGLLPAGWLVKGRGGVGDARWVGQILEKGTA
jgi:hypothetical protein